MVWNSEFLVGFNKIKTVSFLLSHGEYPPKAIKLTLVTQYRAELIMSIKYVIWLVARNSDIYRVVIH